MNEAEPQWVLPHFIVGGGFRKGSESYLAYFCAFLHDVDVAFGRIGNLHALEAVVDGGVLNADGLRRSLGALYLRLAFHLLAPYVIPRAEEQRTRVRINRIQGVAVSAEHVEADRCDIQVVSRVNLNSVILSYSYHAASCDLSIFLA